MSLRLGLSCLAFLCAAAGCGGGLPEPNAADVARAQAELGRSSLAELQEGRRLYVTRCGSCHALRDPLSLPPSAWGEQVDDMRSKRGVRLSAAEAEQITDYLVAISSR